jgi:hypothetical protein
MVLAGNAWFLPVLEDKTALNFLFAVFSYGVAEGLMLGLRACKVHEWHGEYRNRSAGNTRLAAGAVTLPPLIGQAPNGAEKKCKIFRFKGCPPKNH